MNLDNIRIIVSEVDGVVTDGLASLDELGHTVYKRFNLADLDAINFIKKYHIFVFLSNDNSISYNFFRSKNIPFFFAKDNKLNVLSNILNRYEKTADELLYIGSKATDLKCMTHAGISAQPKNASLKKLSNNIIIPCNAGEGVLSCLAYRVLNII